jgi:hypothetical protein
MHSRISRLSAEFNLSPAVNGRTHLLDGAAGRSTGGPDLWRISRPLARWTTAVMTRPTTARPTATAPRPATYARLPGRRTRPKLPGTQGDADLWQVGRSRCTQATGLLESPPCVPPSKSSQPFVPDRARSAPRRLLKPQNAQWPDDPDGPNDAFEPCHQVYWDLWEDRWLNRCTGR